MCSKKYIFLFFCFFWSHFFGVQTAQAFLWEDLGLDLYKQIDEGFYALEQKQYEYEMTGQGEASVAEVVWPILASDGIECDISSTTDIEELLGNEGSDTVARIVESCTGDGESTPALLVERVQNSLGTIKNTFSERARDKSQRTYEVARVWLYNDGDIENSPFDLINDLQEIDRVIFSEELKYEWENSQKSSDEALDDFLEEDKDYLYEEEEDELDDEEDTESGSLIGSGTIDIPPILLPVIDDHKYICAPGDDLSGLDEESLEEVLTGIEGWSGSGYSGSWSSWFYPWVDPSNGASWGGPFPWVGPEWSYEQVTDSWKCDPKQFFCIIIEFQKSDYGLAGGESMAIDKILKKAEEHLEKPANASLTQRKMTTNNFELGSIIKNLPDMLRGLGVEVQTKPIPILDVPSGNEELVEGDLYEVENLMCTFYKNSGLDCERANDLTEFASQEEVEKVLQTSAGMPTQYPEIRNNELTRFQNALKENNRIIDKSVDQQILYDDMKKFGDQFTELEKFVAAMEDFCMGLKGVVTEMKKIPTRSS